MVESSVKKVQHPTGGVVGEVRAHDGDLVKAGDIVVRLDDTVTKANLAIVTKNLDGSVGARRRGWRPSSRASTRSCFRATLLDRADDPDVKNVMASETKLFEVRTTGRIGQKAQLRERITQLNEEIAGLAAQEQAKDQEIALVRKGTGRRSPALRPASGAVDAADHAGARRGAAGRRARAIHRVEGAGQGQDHRDRIADHPGRQGHGQRRLQGSARDQRQDRRIHRAQGHRRRPVAAGRYPRAAGRHGRAIDGSHRRRRDHRRATPS